MPGSPQRLRQTVRQNHAHLAPRHHTGDIIGSKGGEQMLKISVVRDLDGPVGKLLPAGVAHLFIGGTLIQASFDMRIDDEGEKTPVKNVPFIKQGGGNRFYDDDCFHDYVLLLCILLIKVFLL